MPESARTLLLVVLAVAAFIAANIIAGRRMRKAADFIIRDLKEKKAFDPASAVQLPYGKGTLFRIGLKDYRSGALAQLVKYDVIRLQEGDRYYLRDNQQETFNP